MEQSKYNLYDQIVANTISYSLRYWPRNNKIIISERYYKEFENYYNSLLKITLNTYLQFIKIEFVNSSLKFRYQFWKKFKNYAKIKFKNQIYTPNIEIWNPAAEMREETQYFNEIWKEYYDVENA